MTTKNVAILLAGLLITGSAQAALIDRGGGLIYDDVLNITWLQDANYAKTSGYDDDGLMTWDEANSWATGLNIDGVTGWRLPKTNPINGASYDYNYSFDGSTDGGYNISAGGSAYAGSTGSEMAFLFYSALGNVGYYGFDGAATGCTAPDYCLRNTESFNNIQIPFTGGYWSVSGFMESADTAWFFSFYDGYQGNYVKSSSALYAWAVHDGDVAAAAIPEPAISALFLAGLGLIGLMSQRRRPFRRG